MMEFLKNTLNDKGLWIYDKFEHQKPNYDGFEVIVAGLPKTGTMSLRSALGTLLNGACYHGSTMEFAPESKQFEIEHWKRAMRGQVSKTEWVSFLVGRGFRAGMDFPFAHFYKELMEVFPNAKVILSKREPVSWHYSVKNTICKYTALGRDPITNWVTRLVGKPEELGFVATVCSWNQNGKLKMGMLDAIDLGEEEAVEFFNSWNEEVERHVPKDRLLVYNVKEGWEPLVKFLNLPVPDQPFPNINSTATIRRNFQILNFLIMTIFFAASAVFFILFQYLIHFAG